VLQSCGFYFPYDYYTNRIGTCLHYPFNWRVLFHVWEEVKYEITKRGFILRGMPLQAVNDFWIY